MPALEGWTLPANDVYAGGLPREWVQTTVKIETVTGLRSGKFVKKGTTGFVAAAAGDKNAIAVLGTRNFTNPDWDHTTVPAVNDVIEAFVLVPGVVVKVRNGANLGQGDQAQVGANGTITTLASAAAGDTAKRVCRVVLDSDGSGSETDALVVIA